MADDDIRATVMDESTAAAVLIGAIRVILWNEKQQTSAELVARIRSEFDAFDTFDSPIRHTVVDARKRPALPDEREDGPFVAGGRGPATPAGARAG